MNYHNFIVRAGVLAIAGIANFWQPSLGAEPDCKTQPDRCIHDDDPRSPDTEIEILSPSANSQLSTPMPTLSWSAVAGATSYIIRVQDLEESEVQQEVNLLASDVEVQPEGNILIDYVFNRPLSPGKEYQIIIETMIEDTPVVGEVIFSTSTDADAINSN